MEADKAAFDEACLRVQSEARLRNSIGTMGEKSLHAALKLYFEPRTDCHEVKLGDYVADIVGERGIIEIQTRGFSHLAPKVEKFLEYSPVTVVYPIITRKKIICVDEPTGEVTSRYNSPLHGSIYTVFDELWGISGLLGNPRFTLCLLLCEADEYRLYGGEKEKRAKRQRSRKGCFKSDRIPTRLVDEVYLRCVEDYARLIPDELSERFTAAEFIKATKTGEFSARSALKVLTGLGVCERLGKEGRSYVYSRRKVN